MTPAITARTDLRSLCTFVAKAEVYRWEEDFGVSVDWRPCTTPPEPADRACAAFASRRRRWRIHSVYPFG